VRKAATPADFLADPIGAYFAGRSFVAWMTPSLVGASHFGAFDGADLPVLLELADMPLHAALVPPYDVIHDLGGVGVLDRRAFEVLEQYLRARMPQLVGRARKVAVVRPAGMAGAAFSGLFHDFTAPHFDGGLFHDRDEALAWLGLPDEVRADIFALVAPFEQAPLLRRVRELVATDPAGATLERVAMATAHSVRSLQRHLAELGTSFRDELATVRVDRAKARLAETDDKIEAIASDLGFASAAAFTTSFGRLAGESPQRYRTRSRG
jgi:AraC-like DNA-binding protein